MLLLLSVHEAHALLKLRVGWIGVWHANHHHTPAQLATLYTPDTGQSHRYDQTWCDDLFAPNLRGVVICGLHGMRMHNDRKQEQISSLLMSLHDKLT